MQPLSIFLYLNNICKNPQNRCYHYIWVTFWANKKTVKKPPFLVEVTVLPSATALPCILMARWPLLTQQYPPHRSSLKTVHRTVLLTLRPSQVQVLFYINNKEQIPKMVSAFYGRGVRTLDLQTQCFQGFHGYFLISCCLFIGCCSLCRKNAKTKTHRKIRCVFVIYIAIPKSDK